MPSFISATYQIVTPMFIGDANQKPSGISPASVKGALRFWWRALNWGRIREQQGIDSDESALKLLHQQEGELFGSAAENGPGQSKFMLSLKTNQLKTGTPNNPGSGTQYLLGLGLYHFKNQFLREAVLSGQLEVKLLLKPQITEQQTEQLCNALKALGFLGGLGSRARKGLGSLTLQKLFYNDQSQQLPNNKTALKALISQWLNTSVTSQPPFTAFSQQTRIDFSAEAENSKLLLEYAGKEQQLYRSWGRNGKVADTVAEQNFKNDHDQMQQVAGGANPRQLPERSVFGLPHNYFFSSSKKKVDITPDGDRNRRASPLFIHIHQFPDNSCVLIQSLFPAKFLNDGELIEFLAGNGRSKTLAFKDADIDWRVIHRYLDRFPQLEMEE